MEAEKLRARSTLGQAVGCFTKSSLGSLLWGDALSGGSGGLLHDLLIDEKTGIIQKPLKRTCLAKCRRL